MYNVFIDIFYTVYFFKYIFFLISFLDEFANKREKEKQRFPIACGESHVQRSQRLFLYAKKDYLSTYVLYS